MTSHSDCIFCKIVAGTVPCFKLAEDDKTLAFMDINPANPGHALVIPKLHAPNIFELPTDEFGAVMAMVQRVARAVQATLEPDGMNILQANGPGAAQSVMHFHMHVLPRRMDDQLLMNWGLHPGNMDDIRAVAERIRNAL